MFVFFRSKVGNTPPSLTQDRWKWDPAKGIPSKKVLKLQRQALRSGSLDVKRRVCANVQELAEASPELQGVLGDAKITADLCKAFLDDLPASPPCFQRALLSFTPLAPPRPLSALCYLHPANCAAVVAARSPAPHALGLIAAHDRDTNLAQAAAALLDVLAATCPSAVTPLLLQPGGASGVLAAAGACSRAALDPATPPARASGCLALLRQLLGLLLTCAAGGGPPMCRELGKAQGLRLLLELTQEHRGQGQQQQAQAGGQAEGGGGGVAEGGGGGPGREHAAVVRDALSLLGLIVSQVPAHRLPLLEADGVQRLLRALRDASLPWSVRQHAMAALAAAAASATVADEVERAGGLDMVYALLDALAGGRQAAGGGAPAASPGKAAAGWCGLRVLSAELREGSSPRAGAGGGGCGVVGSGLLRAAVRLLDATAPAVLAAVGAGPGAEEQAAAEGQGAAVGAAGRAFLASERVVSDLRASAAGLLELLVALAEAGPNRVALQQMGAAEAVRRLMHWRHVQ
ncbi:hypothetical protein TSOC_003706, partial [Tetrabaena socialis]